jgi:1-acyl-sn-glycerol-3-phosphate acyltransferase
MLTTLSRLIVRTFFREVVIEGRERLPAVGPVIFAPNHPNVLIDPLLLMFLSPPFHIRFVAKEPLFTRPVLGWIMRRMQAIPVVRRMDAEGEVDYTTFFAACVEALAAGDSIVIFPEGRSLPQPYMAPLRTGAARLFFLAREKGINASLVPVGLNYERGAIFRTSVLVSIAPLINTAAYVAKYETDPHGAVHELTAEVSRSLEGHVFQAETFRDRELLLLLERLYAEDGRDDSWPQRVTRLKEFETGLTRLREHYPREIDRLRHLLARYERLTVTYGVRESMGHERSSPSVKLALLGACGMVLASMGWLLNWLPYRLCGRLVQLTKRDEAAAATYKIVYSLFLFPLAYVVEGILIARWFGWAAVVVFAVCIIPLSYFTLLFFEWREELGARSARSSAWFAGNWSRRVTEQLARLRQRIVAEVDALASRPELHTGPSGSATPSSQQG